MAVKLFTLSFLTMRPFFFHLFQKLYFHYSHYFLNSAGFYLQLPPLSVPVIISVPIKFVVRLGTLSARQERWSCCDLSEIVKIVKVLILLPACTHTRTHKHTHTRVLSLIRNFWLWHIQVSYKCPHWHSLCSESKYWKLQAQKRNRTSTISSTIEGNNTASYISDIE